MRKSRPFSPAASLPAIMSTAQILPFLYYNERRNIYIALLCGQIITDFASVVLGLVLLLDRNLTFNIC